VKLLLDEMYPAALAMALREEGINAVTAVELGPAGRPDIDVFTIAADGGYAILTENISDFARISGEHVAGGSHHRGVLIALSARFSRRPAGYGAIVAAIAAAVAAVDADRLDDRLVYLEQAKQPSDDA
jgi:Domain of unknown function (DUF5615)